MRGFDYAAAGAYFVTISTKDRACTLGRIVRGVLLPTELGVVARRCWDAIPDHFPHVELDAFVVMPNHVHGILHLRGELPSGLPSDGQAAGPRGPKVGSLGAIVGSFKSAVSRIAGFAPGSPQGPRTPIWHRSFHESIIPNPVSLLTIRAYIRANPARWSADRNGEGRVVTRR